MDLAAPFHIPLNPLTAVRAASFGRHAIQSVTRLARRFETPQARALLGGCAAHSMLRLTEPLSGAFGLVLLSSAHAVGWPITAGGSQRLADALNSYLAELGGEGVTDRRVASLNEPPPLGAALLGRSPKVGLAVVGDARLGPRLPRRRRA